MDQMDYGAVLPPSLMVFLKLPYATTCLQRCFISALRVETPCAASRNPWRQNFGPIFLSFGPFETPPTKISYTTTHYYQKYESRAVEKLVNKTL